MTSEQTGPAEDVVVNHIGLCVSDLDRSRRFYEDVLGFVFDRELQPPDGPTGELLEIEPPVNATAIYLTRGSFVLELLHFDRPGNPPAQLRTVTEIGLTHISLSVEDLEAAVALVPERGGRVLSTVMGAFTVRDPDGQLLELLPMAYHRRLQQGS